MSGAAGPSPTSTTTTTSAKVSKFAVKSGFVIPKNKLSGSLVPIYRDKKSAGVDAATKESNKQLHRKTKWGPDPTQDAAVRKGRALAYQTRVDQIVQQLKSGKLDFDENLDSSSAAEQLDEESLSHDSKKSKLLELEKMEIIGEILKLNANYKAPPDYKPLLKEDRLTIPVKEFPGYNFIGLIFGPGGDNRKRLEKETGAKIQVYGIKPGKDKGEVIPSDSNDFQGYDEIYVQVSAETFEKVDSAVSIIELLITSVSGNLAGASTLSADYKNTHNAASSQAPTAPDTVTPEEVDSGSFQAPPTGQFQYTAPWFTSVGTSMPPPQFVPPPSSAAPFSNATHQQPPPLNPTNTALPFGSQPLPGFNFPPQNPTLVPPRHQHPPQVNPYMSQPRPSDVNAPISNQTPFPFSGSQPLQSAPFSRPLLSQQSVNPQPMSFQSGPSMQNSLPLQPNHPPLHSNFPSQLNPLPSRSLAPPFQPGPSSFSGPMQNFPPTRPSVVSAPHPNSGDFTFQPHHPHSSQNFPPGPGNRPPPHILPSNQPLPPPPFRPDLHHQMQPFSRPPMLHPNHQSFQNHGPSQPPPPPLHQLGQQMNYGAANPGPAFHSRPRNFMEPQQMYRGQMAPHDILPPQNHQFRHNPSFGGPYNRAPGPGELQVYDPFSPTSVANMRPRQEDNSGTARRQENDPEYEDLMASVGVK